MSGPRTYGLSAREQEIMDFSDAGVSTAMIARELELDPGYTRQVVQRYAFAHCWANSDRFTAMVRAGDRAYAAALRRTGKLYA